MKAAVIALLALLVGCKPSTTIKVPVEACKSQYTGQQRDAGYWMQQCSGYDKNMVCTVFVPIYIENMEQEVLTKCEFKEWRTAQ